MAFLSALETLSFFEASLSFFRSELPWFFLCINFHGVGVFVRSTPSRGRGVECDGGSGRVLLCDQGHKMSLTEELVDFLVPSFGHGGNYFHAIDSVREPDWNPCLEVVDDGCSVGSGI